MHRIKLVNLPFASLSLPSIALMQLQRVAQERFGDEVHVEIHYLNHDFVDHFGMDLYHLLANSVKDLTTGAGDWLFRQIAFPEEEDNQDAYFQRYYRGISDAKMRQTLIEKREGLEALLDDLIDRYDLTSADIVGCTSMFNQHAASIALLRKIKERAPNVTTIMGGANCEAPMGKVIADRVDAVDYVFSGSSLESFPRFLQHHMAGQIEACDALDGVFTARNVVLDPREALRNGDGQSTGTGAEEDRGASVPRVAPVGKELHINDTPVDLDYRGYLEAVAERFPDEGVVGRHLLIETSRGCWWGEKSHCTFCGLNGATIDYRAMTPERAREFFQSLFELAPMADRIDLNCVDNILPTSYIQEVFAELETPENMRFFYEVKADLSAADMAILAKANVTKVQPGIEALSTPILKLMRKGTTAYNNVRFLKNCFRYGIEPAWNILMGFPGEPKEVYEKYLRDIPLLSHLPPPSGAFPVRFDRYSPYYDAREEYGLDLRPLDFYGLVYPFPAEDIATMAYYFQDHKYGAEYMMHVIEYIRPMTEKVSAWKQAWQREQGPPQLALEERPDGAWIEDGRPGFEASYRLQDDEAQVLRALDEPVKEGKLGARVEDVPDERLPEIVARLESKGLVFREDDRLVGLVMSSEDYTQTYDAGREAQNAFHMKLNA